MYNTDLPTRAELPSAGRLLRSTAIAALIAGGLLVTTILPAEYGIDPTGVGRALGLARMGEIKNSLIASANAGETAPSAGVRPAKALVEVPALTGGSAEGAPSAAAAKATTPASQHTTNVTLKNGQAAEIKLVMRKDASVRYEWSTAGVPVNFDTHGDPVNAPKDFYHGYGKGRNKTGDAGTLQAAFDGKHGWYWRNRSGADVTITLKTDGDYEKLERVL
jgi:hypothetical protein